jgi:imidazolonepropionase
MVPSQAEGLGVIRDAALAAADGRVVWIGPDREVEASVRLDGDLVDAAGACVLPGLVDPHTHLVFAGSRWDEFAERVSHEPRGHPEKGIPRTVKATGSASTEELVELAVERAGRFLANGTTTIEAKTGYGLDFEGEERSLQVLRRTAAESPLRIVPTFLAHIVPPRADRKAYVAEVGERMLPAFKRQAHYFDVWCDPVAFTPEESRQLFGVAQQLGYGLRMHTAQVAPGPGPDIAAEFRAASVDHLEHATAEQARKLAEAGSVAVLCPLANFTMPGSPRPPIEAFREAGTEIALASDLNPGNAPSESLALAMSLAMICWGMTIKEVLRAVTTVAARSIGLEGVAGCLRPGSFADLAIYDAELPEEIPYYVGIDRVLTTVVGGRQWSS